VYEHYQKIWNQKITEFKCDFCDRVFPEKNNAYRCHKVSCQKKWENIAIQGSELQKEDNLSIEDKYEILRKKVEELEKENEALKKKTGLVTTVVGDNNNVSVTNINITLNPLGKEDLSHLVNNEGFKKRLDSLCRSFANTWNALPYLIQQVFFGNESNNNIIVDNPNDEFAYFYDGKDWLLAKKSEIFDKVIIENWERMTFFVSEATLGHKYFKKLEEHFVGDPKYQNYLKGQCVIVFVNQGKGSVLDNTGSETATLNKINKEFLLD
jgi:hypothetical protein